MHLPRDPHPHREAASLRARSMGAWRVLAVLVVASVGFSVVAHAQHFDRWRRGHSQAGEFRAPRFGPNAHGFNASRPNAFEQNRGTAVEPGTLAPNQRLGAATPEERR